MTTNYLNLAVQIISIDEGFRDHPYYCTAGYPTIGYGFRIAGLGRHDPLPVGMRMSLRDADTKLRDLVDSNAKTISANPDIASAFDRSSDVRKAVMLSIAHQLGMYGLLKFKKFLTAMSVGSYQDAASQLINSLAARQTPNRWGRNAAMVESGELHGYYGRAS